MTIQVVNPATGETVRHYECLASDEIEERLTLAEKAFGAWKTTSLADRAVIVSSAGDILEARSAVWAETITLEMEKPHN